MFRASHIVAYVHGKSDDERPTTKVQVFLSCSLPEIAIVFLLFPGHHARELLAPGKKGALLEPSLCFNETKSHKIEAEV